MDNATSKRVRSQTRFRHLYTPCTKPRTLQTASYRVRQLNNRPRSVGAAALELAGTRTLPHERGHAIAGSRMQSSEEPLIQHVIVVHNTTPIPTVVCPYCHRGPSPTIQYKVWNKASLM